MKYLLAAVLCTAICYVTGCNKDHGVKLKTEVVKIDSGNQVIFLSDSLVKPIIYADVSNLKKFGLTESKSMFISIVLPAILIAKFELQSSRLKIERLRDHLEWRKSDSAFYETLAKRYKAKNTEDLLLRMETLPVSIALAQSAVETGWGNSRFFYEGNNLFGIWSLKKDDARMAANRARKGNAVYVKTYPDISRSATDYFEILGRSNAYRDLRKAMSQTNDPFALIPHLKYYSEQRSLYTRKLKSIIVQHDLTRYDYYQIDPEYIVDD
jgi:Bax protein